MIHLDTNFLVRGIVPGSGEAGKISAWLLSGEELERSSMAWGEYLCGPLAPAEEAAARALIQDVHSVGREAAERAAQLFNLTGRRSRSFADCLIAAIAVQRGAKLATSNTADFAPFVLHGLTLA